MRIEIKEPIKVKELIQYLSECNQEKYVELVFNGIILEDFEINDNYESDYLIIGT